TRFQSRNSLGPAELLLDLLLVRASNGNPSLKGHQIPRFQIELRNDQLPRLRFQLEVALVEIDPLVAVENIHHVESLEQVQSAADRNHIRTSKRDPTREGHPARRIGRSTPLESPGDRSRDDLTRIFG